MPGTGQGNMAQQMMSEYGQEAEAKPQTCFHCDKEIKQNSACIELVHWPARGPAGHQNRRLFHVECFEELAGKEHIPPLPEVKDPIDELEHIPEDLKQKLQEILLQKKIDQLERAQAQYEKQKIKDSFYKGVSHVLDYKNDLYKKLTEKVQKDLEKAIPWSYKDTTEYK